jgi:hypothetical protein
LSERKPTVVTTQKEEDEQTTTGTATNGKPKSAQPLDITDMSFEALVYYALLGDGRIGR